jgi:GT2 family glycosyltransferase
VAVVVVARNGWSDLEGCLRSVESGLGGLAAELVLVDSASTDETPRLAAHAFPSWQVISTPTNVLFGGGNAIGFERTTAPYVFLLNPDTVLEPDCIRRLVAAMDADPKVGVIGPLKLNTDGSVQPSWGWFPNLWQEFLKQTALYHLMPMAVPTGRHFQLGQRRLLPHDRARDVDWVTGSALLLRRAAAPAPLFARGYYLYREECTLCYQVRHAGWRVLFLPEARLRHAMWQTVSADPYLGIRLRLRGEALHFELEGTSAQRRGFALMSFGGSAARAGVRLLLALVTRGARRHAHLRAAHAYWEALGELGGLLLGRFELRRAVLREVG